MSTVAFHYNPRSFLKSYAHVLKNVKEYYSDSEIFVYLDNNRADLIPYIELALDYRCIVSVRNKYMYYIDRNEHIEVNYPKMKEWINRLRMTCEEATAEWIMLLEDDVVVKRRVKHWPTADCGKNRHDIGFLGGGSVFRREVFLECLKKTDVADLILKDSTASWAGDFLLSLIFRNQNCTEEKWVELAEPGYWDDKDHAVFHGYKDLCI